jgi:hypothetical protein
MTNTYATTRKDGLMWAECWCMGTTVLVTPGDVRAGRTGSCERRDGLCVPGYEPPAPPPPARPGTLWAVLDCAQPNRVRRDASEFGSAIVSGERESPRDVGSSGGVGQSLLNRNQHHAE